MFGRVFENPADLGGQLLGEPFVGIDDHHPGMCGLRHGPVDEVAVVDVLPPDNATAVDLTDDIERSVGRAGVGHEDLVGDITNRLDARADILSLVLAGYEDGQHLSHGTGEVE